MKKYIDKNGREMFVAKSFDGRYGTFRSKKTGSLQRVKSEALPMTTNILQADDDLERYARKNGLKAIFE